MFCSGVVALGLWKDHSAPVFDSCCVCFRSIFDDMGRKTGGPYMDYIRLFVPFVNRDYVFQETANM